MGTNAEIKQLLREIQGSVERIELKQREHDLRLAVLARQLAELTKTEVPDGILEQIQTGTLFHGR